MAGFKSFAERTILQFPAGIASVVGPNGCGKSNIVDALRWVMGEQSARHLRGQMMGDVIFNGSERFSPTGMAEVSLILDNEDGRGPAEYSGFTEIMITRRLFRSGESEYEINKSPCRLKDIIEFFLGTGVGNKAYSIVEQGRVDEMINAKPEERRAIIEEAAGTSKYRSRKLVAERKLERTHQNLLRVNDVVREIERQIRSMELQAKKAERYRALKQQVKEKDLAWSFRQKKLLGSDIAQLEIRLKESEDRLARHFAAVHAKEAEGEALRLALLETEGDVEARQEAVYQQKVHTQGVEQRIHFTRREREELEEAEKKTRIELSWMQDKLQILSREIDDLRKARESFVQLSLFEENFLRDKEAALERIGSEISKLQSEAEAGKAHLIDLAGQEANLKNGIAAAERNRGEILTALARNREENDRAARSLELWAGAREERKTALDRCVGQAAEAERESDELSASIRTWGEEKEVLEERIAALKERLQEARSLLLSLEELQRNYEGYQEGVRAIMLNRQREPAFEGVCGLVAEVIEAPEEYEKALAAVLGDRLQYVIVGSHETGLKAIEHLKRESEGRGTFIPLRLFRRERRPLPLDQPEVIAALIERVSVKEGYREIAEHLLGDVVLVSDLEAAFRLWSRNGFMSTLVTLDGEIIDPSGVATGGSAESLEGGFLSQKRRIKELQALASEIELELREEADRLGAVREQLHRVQERKAALVEESHRLALEKVRLEHDLLQAEQEIARLEGSFGGRAQEEAELTQALRLREEEIAASEREIEAALHERSGREKALGERQEALSVLTREAESLEANVTESRIRGAALGERKEHVQSDLENRLGLREDLSRQVSSRESHQAELAEKRNELEEALRAAEAALEDGKAALAQLEERLEDARQRYRETSRQLMEIEEEIKEIRPLGEAAQEEKNRCQLMISEKNLRLQHLADAVQEKYNLDLGELIEEEAAAASSSDEDLQSEIEDLRSRLERMGEVNLAAIGEFEELSGRHRFLIQQREDLERSIADLQRTIAKLNRICRSRFKESFEEINQKFQEIFPRLFHGGKAHLVLTDENDYLETGVEIVGQPPGKKLQSIILLSGGEKALTAVSLLFAIFLTKPSPFCFLDEVDAPLDDANIDRFNDIVREMSRISQFVLITHNKRTMQVAEVLYGITMEEPGVSKVVSVKMN